GRLLDTTGRLDLGVGSAGDTELQAGLADTDLVAVPKNAFWSNTVAVDVGAVAAADIADAPAAIQVLDDRVKAGHAPVPGEADGASLAAPERQAWPLEQQGFAPARRPDLNPDAHGTPSASPQRHDER